MPVTRRDQILATAADLFAERGFHGVSVHDIGAACGISGPALYKHFTGKDDLLAHCLTDISTRLLAEGMARSRAAGTPDAALDALIDWHVEFALENPSVIVIQDREWPHLSADVQSALRTLQLRYIDIWVDTLRQLRDDLDRPTARAVVQAGFGLLNSTPRSARIPATAMAAHLHTMARAALLAR